MPSPQSSLIASLNEPYFEILDALKSGASTIDELRGRITNVSATTAIRVRLATLERVGLVVRCRSGASDCWHLRREGVSIAIARLVELLSEASEAPRADEFAVRVARIFRAYKVYFTETRLLILKDIVSAPGSAIDILQRLDPKVARNSVDDALWAFERAGLVSIGEVGAPPGTAAAVRVVFSATASGAEMVRAIRGESVALQYALADQLGTKPIECSALASQCSKSALRR